MRILNLIIIFVLITLTSCGSSKSYTNSKNGVSRSHAKREQNNNNQLSSQTNKSKNISVPDVTQQYINKYAPIAVEEMNLYKIPASITLAQGILESGSGRSILAIRSNNHFGIKCHNKWEGESVTHDDDKLGECFRKYEHPETSYEDHSKFLTRRKRYAKLFEYRINDYVSWAYGLKKAGYATDPKYPKKLIELIEKYELYNYDNKKTISKQNQKIDTREAVLENNSQQQKSFYTIRKGDTLYSIARNFNITVSQIKQLNGLIDNSLKIGQLIRVK